MLTFLISLAAAGDINVAIKNASKLYNINPEYMYNVLNVESGHRIYRGVRLNKNGSFDTGPFQINSVHINTTCKEYILIKVQDNANCAAKMIAKLKTKFAKQDKNWLSRYHSNTPEKRKIYEEKLFLAKDF